ncbi:hypothetical protein ABN028_34495 [Actinopolymorpha sp. B17G11]|uniref:hypothetical protein n=1 Tax=Actinopolymorpha sp. B17G11 TaxID=3160861 RepID=UPI0032E49B21
MAVSEVAGWVWPANLRTTMQYLSMWIGYDFDDTDWDAINHGFLKTSGDPPGRPQYDYPIVGSPILTVLLARDPGADPVSVLVRGEMDDILRARIDTLLSILAEVQPAPDPDA